MAEYQRRHDVGNACQMAEIFADAGDPDRTFGWLGHTARVRDPRSPWALIMPFFEQAWQDPRFAGYRAELGL